MANTIQEVRVEWCPTYDNLPRLEVLLDEMDNSVMRYERRNNLWLAIDNDRANYLHWKGPHNEGGYAGRDFVITTKEGEEVTLRGPWSSNSDAVNRLFPDTPVVEASITNKQSVFDMGYTFYSGAILVNSLLRFKGKLKLTQNRAKSMDPRLVLPDDTPVRLALLNNDEIQPVIYTSVAKWETKEQWRYRVLERSAHPSWQAQAMRRPTIETIL